MTKPKSKPKMSAECFYAKRIAELEKYGYSILTKNGIEYGPVIKLGNMESIRTWRDDTTKSIQEVLDYLLSISKLDKSKIKFETDPKLLRKIDVDCEYVDITKFKSEIEQSKEYTFEQCMQDLLDYWRKNV